MLPKHFNEVLESLEQSSLCDVHFSDNTKTIIVTLEGDGVAEETKKLKEIQTMERILSAEMSYSYSEDELETLRKNVALQQGTVPTLLNDDDAKAEDIHYGGDINHELIKAKIDS